MFYLSKETNSQAGFTLLEMMVVVGIFLVTSGIVLSNFKGFTRASSLDLLVREMSLTIRQSQVYGSATRRYEGSVSSGENRFPSYGAYVAGGGATSFMLFADKNGDGYYDGSRTSCSEECVEQFNLTGGANISEVQGCWDSESPCVPAKKDVPGAGGDNEWLNIMFQRPKLGANFDIKCAGGNCPSGGPGCSELVEGGGISRCPFSYVKITVTDPLQTTASSTRNILVWNTGHIYVESELGD